MLGEAVLAQDLSSRTLKSCGSTGGWCSGEFRCHLRVSRWVAELGWVRVRWIYGRFWKAGLCHGSSAPHESKLLPVFPDSIP